MMETHSHKHVVVLALGLPVLTTAIVLGSMYAGHYITTRSDRPTNVMVSAATPNIDVNVASATPKIDVNVPQAAPPSVSVNATAPHVDVHVPNAPAPTVTFNPPAQSAPNITVNSPPAQVTVIREEHTTFAAAPNPAPATSAAVSPAASIVTPAPATSTTPNTSGTLDAPATIKPAASATPASSGEFKSVSETPINVSVNSPANTATPVAAVNSTGPVAATNSIPAVDLENPTIDTLYEYATKYIDAYCIQHKLDPKAEAKKWNRDWLVKVEQAVTDDIDSSEQSYINRQVIAKRDYFRLDKTTPDKAVEACRIILRYRDAQLTWLQALQDAMTKENLKKTVTFLAAGTR